MKAHVVFLLGALLLAALAAPRTAYAQYNSGAFGGHSDNPNGPTVSPYLNLTQNNNFGGLNYQTLVKPFIDQGNAIQRQGNSLSRLQQQVNTPGAGQNSGGRASSTGHSTAFLNMSHYFPQQAPRQAPRQ